MQLFLNGYLVCRDSCNRFRSRGNLLLPIMSPEPRFTLVIHGGAGTITRENSSPERQAQYKQELKKALIAGYAILEKGGEAMDAAVAAVSVMEGESQLLAVNSALMIEGRLSVVQCGKGRRIQCRWQSQHMISHLTNSSSTLISKLE